MNVPYNVRLHDVRLGTADDFVALARPGGLAEAFFEESEFARFTRYDPEQFIKTVGPRVADGNMILLLALRLGEPVGFMMFNIARHYSTDKLAHMFLLYVRPQDRGSRLGRMLVAAATSIARREGAVAFYVGSSANISGKNDKRLMNLFSKFGFKPLGGLSRLVFGE